MANINNSISIFSSVSTLTPDNDMPLDIFLDNIKDGHWQDIVLPIRAIKEEKERNKAKAKAPYVTLSGSFKERTDAGLLKHSGFIGIDIDEKNLPDSTTAEQLKELLKNDVYVVAAFSSISGRGLCAVFKINAAKHRETFKGICEYLLRRYNIVCDPTSVNVSRARFVSYDPHLYYNPGAEKFLHYIKDNPPKQVDKIIFTQTDFDEIIKQIQDKNINITEDSYYTWMRIGFALAHKFGEAGRQYFHIISYQSDKCRNCAIDKQYTACLRAHGSREATIATFYYYAKQAGVQIYGTKTKTVGYTVQQGKKAGLSKEQIAANLEKFEGIKDAEEAIQQAFDSNTELNEDTLLDQLEIYLRQRYKLERNLITRYIECEGTAIQQADLNSMYIKAKKVFNKLSYELFDRLINSDFVPSYNPLLRYISSIDTESILSSNKDVNLWAELSTIDSKIAKIKADYKLITALFSTISTTDSDYLLYFGTKWLCGLISSIYGQHCPLVLILTGEGNEGKTEWFRRLFPAKLKPYYAESKLDAGKDDEILMTQKLLIMDDEMSGKSKSDEKKLKYITSKQVFSLREPYGRNNVDLLRLALLAGTSNDGEVIDDPTGNRRKVPVAVHSINYAAYNNIDKEALFYECVKLYNSGFRHDLNKVDIQYLRLDESSYTVANAENELILKYFKPGTEQELTATEVKVLIESKTNQKLSLKRIGMELKRMNFAQKHINTGTTTRRVYLVDIIA